MNCCSSYASTRRRPPPIRINNSLAGARDEGRLMEVEGFQEIDGFECLKNLEWATKTIEWQDEEDLFCNCARSVSRSDDCDGRGLI